MTSRSSSRFRSSNEPSEVYSPADQDPVTSKRARVSTSSSTPSGDIPLSDDDEDNDDGQKEDTWGKECKFNKALFELPTWNSCKISAKDDFKWKNLSKDVQNLCVKTLVRFFLFRASKGEIITRTAIADQLTKAGGESNFRSHAVAAIHYANEVLEREFGYVLVNASDIVGYNEEKFSSKPTDKAGEKGGSERTERNNNFFVVNNMTSSPRLLHALVDSRQEDAALVGFMYAVFTIVFVSENNHVRVEALRRQLRAIDDRFPQTASKAVRTASSASTVAVPELKDELE